MLDSKRILLIFSITVFAQFSFSQIMLEKTWGINVTPGFSKTKNVGSVTFPPSFINLKISEPWQFVTHAELFLAHKRGHYSLIKTIGFSGYNYYDKWEYDPATTATNYVWGKRSFIFVYVAYKISRAFPIKKISLVPDVGLSYDYMVKAIYNSESKIGSVHQNLLSQLDRNNFGICASAKIKFKFNEKLNMQIGPYYKQLIKEYRLSFDKKLYFVGLSMDLMFIKH